MFQSFFFFFLFIKNFIANLIIIQFLEYFFCYSGNLFTYKILDITYNKIILSHNVVFFECDPGDNCMNHCSLEIFNSFNITKSGI